MAPASDGVVYHVDCRTTVADNQWHDELHPTDRGFKSISDPGTREMFDRYNTVDRDDARQAVDQLREFLGNVDHSVYHEVICGK